MAKPDDFDGKPSNFKKFWQQVRLYIAANEPFFADDNAKIMFILSYMKTGLAKQWAENQVDEAQEEVTKFEMDENGDLILDNQQKPRSYKAMRGFPSLDEFGKRLSTSFGNPNEDRDNQNRLSLLKQGSMTCEEFFQKFDLYR
jgi:hypothetical protein